MVVAGIALLLLCGVLVFVRRSMQDRWLAIRSAEASTAKELSEAASYVAERLGEAGSFSRIANLNGTVKSDAPLISEVAQQPCVYYEMRVTREYEEFRGIHSRRARRVRRPRRRSETVASNSQRIPFTIEDATGRIAVDPEQADIDGVKVVDRFEPASSPGGSLLRFGAFSIDLGNQPFGLASGSRTLGYHLQEKLIPTERRVYVLGEARDDAGKLAIQKPREQGKEFIISLKSQDELISSTESAMKWLMAAVVTSGAAGAGLIVAGLAGLAL